VEKYGGAREATDDNIIRRMRFACWMTLDYQHKLTVCNTYCFSTATVVTQKLHPVGFVHTLRLIFSTSLFSIAQIVLCPACKKGLFIC
jgi:hypothetical protein